MKNDHQQALINDIVYLRRHLQNVSIIDQKQIKIIKNFQTVSTLNRERNEYYKTIEDLKKENKKLKVENTTLKEEMDPYVYLNKIVNGK